MQIAGSAKCAVQAAPSNVKKVIPDGVKKAWSPGWSPKRSTNGLKQNSRSRSKKQVEEGKVSRLDADRRLRELQTANTKAHIEASVKSGEMTRTEADELYEELGYK